MDNQIINAGYYSYDKCIEVEDKLKYLRTVRANLLVRTYIKSLLGGLYIKIVDEKRGYANEMIKDNSLTDYSYEATSSMISFFNEDSEIIRGFLIDDNCHKLAHSWIKFKLHGRTYVFDPSLNITVSKENYEGIFLPESFGNVNAKQVKTDLLKILATGERNDDGWILTNGTNDVNSSFYNANIQIKGEEIGEKILTLSAKYNHK